MMDVTTLVALALGALLVLLGGGLWVAMALMGVGLIVFLVGTNAPAGAIMATTIWGGSASWALTALPLFIWMGEILFRTRLSEEMFQGLSPWLGRLPGRLLHINVVGSAVFAAVSGSSAATMATVGRMSLPELKRRGYDERLTIGSLTCAGTLGIMIPPSITFIVYGVAAEVSIARLFAAGVFPGLMLAALFMGVIVVTALLNPSATPPPEPSLPFLEKVRRARHLIPVLLLICFVIGSIYTGFATPTESAATGVFGALLLSALSGTLTWKSFAESVMAATRTSCMISFLIIGALFLSVSVDFIGMPHWIAHTLDVLQLSQLGLIIVLAMLFLVLGCFLDGISIVVLATSLLMPAVEVAEIDKIWFGVFVVLMVELSMVTPPIGLNLFVCQLMSKKELGYIAVSTLPFFAMMLLACVMLVVFPQIATLLPQLLF